MLPEILTVMEIAPSWKHEPIAAYHRWMGIMKTILTTLHKKQVTTNIGRFNAHIKSAVFIIFLFVTVYTKKDNSKSKPCH